MNTPQEHRLEVRGVANVQVWAAAGGDVEGIWRAVNAAPELDKNSWYAYWLLATRVPGAVWVAVDDDGMSGFVTSVPARETGGSVFVWQLWVAPRARRRRVGRLLLDTVLAESPVPVGWLEATVAPGNQGPLALFARFAEGHGVGFERVEGFLPASEFGDGYGVEDLVRVGPFPASSPVDRADGDQ